MDISQLMIDRVNTQNTYSKHSGIRVTKIDKNLCAAEAKLEDWNCNNYGMAHGGLIFTICDMVAGISAISALEKTTLTLSSAAQFIASTKGGVIHAVGRCIKRGKNIAFAEAEVYDDREKLLAQVDFTYYIMDVERVKKKQK